MGREQVLFKSEERKTAQEVAVFLRQVADKIEQGSLILKQGTNEIVLSFPKNLTLEVKVEEETKARVKRTLELEIEWVEGEEEQGGVSIG
ncbi:amphi-Trp domain-containing protein [Desulfohalobiaceae bacterium Ax17]|uniref:amphi-Trp domain-containing protein n=1 Tax=Desulfovulcanus ferrireducens TaxID=2831190 RepID=UPI00207BC931|nr:amphi-Trp domain-containing protein [Desulfovulcanus ferrireducens]MBT8762807.1 amphi-Trp domain-containing protein [Desulfovulcanus ferrireducens]